MTRRDTDATMPTLQKLIPSRGWYGDEDKKKTRTKQRKEYKRHEKN